MTEQEERWQYIAEYRYDEATVTKVRLRETPLNWRVLEAIPVIGSRSYNLRDGGLIRKTQYKGKIFDWYDDALENLIERLGRIEERARVNLNHYIRQREELEEKLENARSIGTTV